MLLAISGSPWHLQSSLRLFLFSFSVFNTQLWVFGDEHNNFNQSLGPTTPCPALLLGSPGPQWWQHETLASKDGPKVIQYPLGVLWVRTETVHGVLSSLMSCVLSLKFERKRYGLSISYFFKLWFVFLSFKHLLVQTDWKEETFEVGQIIYTHT